MTRKVATCGTFDIVHEGHKELLREARALGDRLTVIVVPDRVVYENKGRHHAFDEATRLYNIQKVPYVTDAYIDCIDAGLETLVNLRPDVFVFGYDQTSEERLIELLKESGVEPEYVTIETKNRMHSRQLRGMSCT